MDIHESGEDYLEQILMFSKLNGHARATNIAAALNYTKASVSIAMKNLREQGYIAVDSSNHITLTEAGHAIADRIYARHEKLTAYLISIGVNPDTAEKDACKMEHDLSEETYQAMLRTMNKD